MEVKVSVIVPVYNAKSYIDRCMQHLLSQTLSDIEIILVDDGSTDDSLSICRTYAALNDEKSGNMTIKVIHQSNQGPAAARNVGLRCAKGKWIAFVDPDDYVSFDYCKASYEYGEMLDADIVMFDAVREKEPLVLADDSMLIEDPGDIKDLRCAILYPYMLRGSSNIHIKNQYKLTHKSDIAIAAPWNKLYKKSFLNDNNLTFPEQLKTLDDMTFNYFAFGCSPKVAYLHRKLYHYCFNRKSITNKYDPDRIKKDLDVFKMIGEDIRQGRSLVRYRTLLMAYYARVIKSFAILCRLCFFSSVSPYDLKHKLQLARNTMNIKEYAEAFDNIDIKMLEPRLKAVVFAVRKKRPFVLYLLHVMHSTLQRISS